MDKRTIQICEFDSIFVEDCKALKEFALRSNAQKNQGSLFKFSVKQGKECLIAQNYVGVIGLKDGTVIEILPKIYSGSSEPDLQDATRLLLKMLAACYDIPHKSGGASELSTAKTQILEFFIAMFAQEVSTVVKKGMKHSYETVEANEPFFKGKLKVAQQLRHNLIHKERSYIEYDIFSANCPENRLLKSTLQMLYKITGSYRNKSRIKALLDCFDAVPASQNYKADFRKIIPDRKNVSYTHALKWCELFLQNMSFTPLSGKSQAFSLLFPMEKLFEGYIAKKIKKELWGRYTVLTQDTRYYLFDTPQNTFQLRPDIVVEGSGECFVLDTKWKLLSKQYGASQGDMYQMYAYYHKYPNVRSITLIYPYSRAYEGSTVEFRADDGFLVKIKFVDFHDEEASIRDICTF